MGSAVSRSLLNAHALKDEAGVCNGQHIPVAQRHRLHVGERGGVAFSMDDGYWIFLPRLFNHTMLMD